MTHSIRGLTVLSLCLFATPGRAQEGRPDHNNTTAKNRDTQIDQATHTPGLDNFIRHCVALGNENEIRLAEFAQQKSQSPAVRQFAETMVQDHGQFLQQVSGERRGEPRRSQPGARSGANRPDADRPDTENPSSEQQPNQGTANRPGNSTNDRGGAQADRGVDRGASERQAAETKGDLRQVALIEERIAQQCLESAERELGSKQGADFEKCFFAMQVFKHQEMADKLQVLQEYASPELAQTLQQGLQKTQEHLQMAKQLLEQVDGAETARRTTRQE